MVHDARNDGVVRRRIEPPAVAAVSACHPPIMRDSAGARSDGYEIRRAAIARGIPCITTMSGASAAQRAIQAAQRGDGEVRSLQELHEVEKARAIR